MAPMVMLLLTCFFTFHELTETPLDQCSKRNTSSGCQARETEGDSGCSRGKKGRRLPHKGGGRRPEIYEFWQGKRNALVGNQNQGGTGGSGSTNQGAQAEFRIGAIWDSQRGRRLTRILANGTYRYLYSHITTLSHNYKQLTDPTLQSLFQQDRQVRNIYDTCRGDIQRLEANKKSKADELKQLGASVNDEATMPSVVENGSNGFQTGSQDLSMQTSNSNSNSNYGSGSYMAPQTGSFSDNPSNGPEDLLL